MILDCEINSVAFIGSGKVTQVLSGILYENGIKISGISSRNKLTGQFLTEKYYCDFFEDSAELKADLIIISVNDDSVKSVVEGINPSQKVVFTAGSIDLNNINHPNCGVLYPLQTFTPGKELNSTDIPILLESHHVDFRIMLENFCAKQGFKFLFCDSEVRKHYHLSAVILNNFMNHLAYVSKTELEENGLHWDLIKPLLKETCDKLLHSDLFEGQTGPARRGDLSIIKEHQLMLSGKFLDIYNVMTNSIIETYKK